MKNLFSFGPPPLTITSFLNAGVDATPGNDWMTREISRLPPGLSSISWILIIRAEMGLSTDLRKGEGLTITSPTSTTVVSSGITRLTSLLFVTMTASDT